MRIIGAALCLLVALPAGANPVPVTRPSTVRRPPPPPAPRPAPAPSGRRAAPQSTRLVTGQPNDPGMPGPDERFSFGSYGRIGFSTDTDGGAGKGRQIVAFGPRLIEDNYLELDFNYLAYDGGRRRATVHTTIAFFDELFHYTGQVDAAIAIRQLYLRYEEPEDLIGARGFVWLGSRWVRGNDIYLMNFWPMDDLNLLGMGAGLTWKNRLELHGLVGVNRLENGRSIDRVPVPAATNFGAEEVILQDRQKMVAALSATLLGKGKKLKLYGEFHRLGAYERTLDDSFTETEPLPDDLGYMLGAQFGLWDFARNGHLNVWLRYARGLAVFDELGTPFGLNKDRRAVDAKEYRLAVAGAAEFPLRGRNSALGVQFGAYGRMFIDADGQEEDFDDRFEMAAVIRPEWMYHLWSFGAEASVQVSRPNGLNPQTNRQAVARVMQFALLPGWTWSRKQGVFSRPQLRGIFALTRLNDAALELYPEEDPRATQATAYYIGARAEWWFGRGGGY